MRAEFSYEKGKVLQALRYHFLMRPELRIMIILVNVFALLSAALFYFKKITPLAFLIGSGLWFFLMITFWFIMPGVVYRRAATFQDHFTMDFEEEEFTLGNERGSRTWAWTKLQNFVETPHFFHLYFDSRSFLLVPKEGFGGSDAVFAARQILQQKVERRSVLR